eukprot:CAMPEP_0204908834 /NCGR_PEP_ID=MMETSP1397-20131031/7708_1 /ASSEMBLY_ACC=CAM_ASM_000891 /TAXON_ID=49980 /ORGANISM="Climacostomum Climacostomum virens, Strain Stock W-24" /LENGTH=73 /DNA_ID=CAMNT_0052078503 /DNA_START=687 /DNA_END=908 /DNA_ORIENTATION=+
MAFRVLSAHYLSHELLRNRNGGERRMFLGIPGNQPGIELVKVFRELQLDLDVFLLNERVELRLVALEVEVVPC